MRQKPIYRTTQFVPDATGHYAPLQTQVQLEEPIIIQQAPQLESEFVEKKEVPIWLKANLTIEEAAKYSNIGTNKLREMTEPEDCPFVIWVGRKRLIKRQQFEKYLEKTYSV